MIKLKPNVLDQVHPVVKDRAKGLFATVHTTDARDVLKVLSDLLVEGAPLEDAGALLITLTRNTNLSLAALVKAARDYKDDLEVNPYLVASKRLLLPDYTRTDPERIKARLVIYRSEAKAWALALSLGVPEKEAIDLRSLKGAVQEFFNVAKRALTDDESLHTEES